MNLGDKIKQLQEYLGPEEIAKAIDIPVEVVEKFLSGDISEEVLDGYDLEKTDVRVIEQKKFLRSKITGIISTDNTNGSLLTAEISKAVAECYRGELALLDLKEFNIQSEIMNLDGDALRVNFIAEGERIEGKGERHPKIKNLAVYLASTNTLQYKGLSEKRIGEIITGLGKNYGLVIIDCPNSLINLEEVINYLDFIIVAVECNYIGLAKYRHIYRMLEQLNATDRALVIITKEGEIRGSSVHEFKRNLKSAGNLEILGSINYSCDNYKRGFIINKELGPAINNVVNLITPGVRDNKKVGVFAKWLKGVGK